MLDAYKDDVIAEWKRTRDARDGRPRLTPEEKAALNETAQDAPEAKPEPVPETPKTESAEEPAEPVAVAEPVDAPMPEPVDLLKAPKAPKAAAKPKRNRKPTFAYRCELKDGSQITLDSIEAVRKRGDVVHCHIEPVKRSRKAA